jgi:hypothetical protein
VSHPAAAFPFAYRLPTDVALQIRGTGPARLPQDSPRWRMVVLVLTFFALVGALAVSLPSGDAQALVRQECVHDLDGDSNSVDDPLLCF